MTDQCDVFNDALDNPDCKGILMNCLKSIEKAVRTIRNSVNQNRQTEITANSRLLILQSQSNISLIKFDRYEKRHEENNKQVMRIRTKYLEESIDQQKKYPP